MVSDELIKAVAKDIEEIIPWVDDFLHNYEIAEIAAIIEKMDGDVQREVALEGNSVPGADVLKQMGF